MGGGIILCRYCWSFDVIEEHRHFHVQWANAQQFRVCCRLILLVKNQTQIQPGHMTRRSQPSTIFLFFIFLMAFFFAASIKRINDDSNPRQKSNWTTSYLTARGTKRQSYLLFSKNLFGGIYLVHALECFNLISINLYQLYYIKFISSNTYIMF